jgi:tRNA threonylcarbamoyladenosine biosynthesis protein TsaE
VDGIIFFDQNSPSSTSFISNSDSETRNFGRQLGKILPKNSVVCLFGDLGAGKTTLIKGIVSAVTEFPEEQVNSPTFTYLNIYPGTIPVYHFDLYRLDNPEDFLHMGFEDFFSSEGICCIEWSERIHELLPKGALRVTLSHLSEDTRKIEMLSLEEK